MMTFTDSSIFFDLDGTLADFEGGVAALINKQMCEENPHKKIRRLAAVSDGPVTAADIKAATVKKDAKKRGEDVVLTAFEKRLMDAVYSVSSKAGSEFWANLQLLPNAREIVQEAVNIVDIQNVWVCTAPISGAVGCESGKRAWVAKHFDIPDENVIVTEDKGQVLSNFDNKSRRVLVDDRTKWCDQWHENGGTYIHYNPESFDGNVASMVMLVALP